MRRNPAIVYVDVGDSNNHVYGIHSLRLIHAQLLVSDVEYLFALNVCENLRIFVFVFVF